MTKLASIDTVICVIGLGYVGMPLAKAFARHFQVIGFDIDSEKVKALTMNNSARRLSFTDKPEQMARADFIIICVPTPLTKSKEPDLSALEKAAAITGQNMKKGSTVILESTVYPGVTEEVLVPILEKGSGWRCGPDFKIGYSPERVNPGDDEHTIDKTTKVVAGMDDETTSLIAELYGKVTPKIYIARDIKTAEAAKAVENIQRDMNIALVNELAIVFDKMGLNTGAVLDAAGTKWNFHRYSPGLVGGHCIPVVPRYFIHKALELGYNPQLILSGREINDYMPKHLAEITVKALSRVGTAVRGSEVLIMGLTYKDNVDDAQDSPVIDMIAELKKFGVTLYGYDPLLNSGADKLGIELIGNLDKAPKVDAVIMCVAHDSFKNMRLTDMRKLLRSKPVLIDVKRVFDQAEAEKEGFYYQAL